MTLVMEGHIAVDDQGVARIAGSRIKVIHLVMYKMTEGWTPEQFKEHFPHLSLAQIHAAFTYYYDHKQEIEREIEEEGIEAERMRAEAGESPFAKRMRQQGKLR